WQTSFYGYDGHGNIRFLTDVDGFITDRYDYDAFGNIIAQSGITANNYLYCGEQFDHDIGLYFLRARYMDTVRGRFWTMDEFEGGNVNALSLHKYLYATANPITYVDPSGYITIMESLTVVNLIGLINISTYVTTPKATIEPKFLSRPSLDGILKSIFTLITWTVYGKFSWTISDRHTRPLPAGISVTEEITEIASSGAISVGMKSGSTALTGYSGSVFDSYKIDFWPSTPPEAFFAFEQKIIVGSRVATTVTMIYRDASYFGNDISVFI
ncbi:MAG: RHS repeat-associated core domain-containing protein, partial [Gammaproteobacteria bacterium]|nr:RHS repeat-associated core domain-containing protein [Gammaproteobacteria bacterium]